MFCFGLQESDEMRESRWHAVSISATDRQNPSALPAVFHSRVILTVDELPTPDQINSFGLMNSIRNSQNAYSSCSNQIPQPSHAFHHF